MRMNVHKHNVFFFVIVVVVFFCGEDKLYWYYCISTGTATPTPVISTASTDGTGKRKYRIMIYVPRGVYFVVTYVHVCVHAHACGIATKLAFIQIDLFTQSNAGSQ